jgi:NTP pyrophosphatase (non-canonical NTP hydrolase)
MTIGHVTVDLDALRERLARKQTITLDDIDILFGLLDGRILPTPALHSVLTERKRQDAKWGEQNNDPFIYITVLVEEVGELAQAALHTRFGGHAAAGLRDEAVHTAAVALAIVECLDRGKWRWPE